MLDAALQIFIPKIWPSPSVCSTELRSPPHRAGTDMWIKGYVDKWSLYLSPLSGVIYLDKSSFIFTLKDTDVTHSVMRLVHFSVNLILSIMLLIKDHFTVS